MRAIKADLIVIPDKQVEAIFSLALYSNGARMLYLTYVAQTKGAVGVGAFRTTVWPVLSLWIASEYVIHEGFEYLNVEDAKLERIRAQGDIKILKDFRNGTFHYQPQWRHQRHETLIQRKLVPWVEKLSKRHSDLVTGWFRSWATITRLRT